MDKRPIYHAVNDHVPVNTNEKMMKAVIKAELVSVELDLTAEPQDKIYVTWGQKKKIEEAVAKARKEMTLWFIIRQA